MNTTITPDRAEKVTPKTSLKSILCATDFSSESSKALGYAAAIRALSGRQALSRPRAFRRSAPGTPARALAGQHGSRACGSFTSMTEEPQEDGHHRAPKEFDWSLRQTEDQAGGINRG